MLGIGLGSLFSDWSHEIATAVMPAFLATMGAAAVWLGIIEGVSDGLSSFAKMASGYYTDRLRQRKPIAVAGYVVTALGTAAFALASSAWHVLIARAFAWFGRGVRTPVRKALLAGAVTKGTYGRAFGFERMMDTVGAIVGPATALALLPLVHHQYPTLFAFTLAGWLADKFNKGIVLALGYSLAAVMAVAIIALPFNVWTLAVIFTVGGIYVAVEETLEDSFCAELVGEGHHGIAFGALATVNGIGDFISSAAVGVLWTAFGTSVAFGFSAALFATGSWLVLRVARGSSN